MLQQYCARLGLRYEPLDDSLASDPGRKSFKVSFDLACYSLNRQPAICCVWPDFSKMCNRRLAQVFFNDLDAADAANEEFQEMASGEDATAFHKAFIAEFYVRSELETAESARHNWMKFKENAKNIVLVSFVKFRFVSHATFLLQSSDSLQLRLIICFKSTILIACLQLTMRMLLPQY